MRKRECTEERFLSDVKDHTLTILRDDGVYRHLRCRAPGTGIMGFDIVTWPGHLAYAGDMGDYVFQRTNDMFEFFRHDGISPGYWAEKVVAQDKHDGIENFSVEKFREAVLSDTREHLELDEGAELPGDVAEDIECLLDAENEFECAVAMNDFHSPLVEFNDFWEHDVKEYSYRFIWCCCALVWAIKRYDEAKETQP